MNKSLDEKREKRLKEIADLMKQRDSINTRLNSLMGLIGMAEPIGEAPPDGFSVTREVEELFKEHPQLYILQATSLLKKKFPSYNIERRKVHSSLTYLVERGKAVKEKERGLFSLRI